MKQLHHGAVIEPIWLEEITQLGRERESRPKFCKWKHTTRIHHARALSPTAATDAIIITGVIETEHLDIMTLDIPNAFVKAPITQDCDKVMMNSKDHWSTLFVNFVQECVTTLWYMKESKKLYVILGSDKYKYSKFIEDMKNDIIREKDPFPKTVAEACHILSKSINHYGSKYSNNKSESNDGLPSQLWQRKKKQKIWQEKRYNMLQM